MSVLFWLACGPTSVKVAESDSTGTADTELPTTPDTGTVTIEETGDSSETATPIDTGPLPPPSFQVSGTLVAPAGLSTVAGNVTVAVQTLIVSGDVLTWGEVIATSTPAPFGVGGSVSFEIDVPLEPPSEAVYVDPEYPDTNLVTLAGVAWVDEDGNGQQDPTDTWVSSTLDLVAWVGGVLPSDFVDEGIGLGWNFVVVDALSGATIGSPIDTDLAGWALEANLLPRSGTENVTLQLAALPGPAPGDHRVDLYSLGDLATETPVDDPTLTSATFLRSPAPQVVLLPTAIPPDEHLFADLGDGAIPGALFGVYAPIAYIDLDEDSQWDGFPPELPVLLVPEGGLIAFYVRYTGPEALAASLAFGGAGWTLFDAATETWVPWSTPIEMFPI